MSLWRRDAGSSRPAAWTAWSMSLAWVAPRKIGDEKIAEVVTTTLETMPAAATQRARWPRPPACRSRPCIAFGGRSRCSRTGDLQVVPTVSARPPPPCGRGRCQRLLSCAGVECRRGEDAGSLAEALACPHLVSRHLVVGEHLLDGRTGRQHVEFVGRARKSRP